jgi:hypothetical protein
MLSLIMVARRFFAASFLMTLSILRTVEQGNDRNFATTHS